MNIRVVMSSKGQVVVPKEIRDAHGWKAGSQIELVDEGGRVEMRPVKAIDPRFPPVSWQEFEAGRLKLDRPFPTDDEMNDAVLREAARRFDASGS